MHCTNAVLDVQDEIMALLKKKRRPSANAAAAADGALRMAQASLEVSTRFAEIAVQRAAQDAEIAQEACQDVAKQVKEWQKKNPLPEQPLSPPKLKATSSAKHKKFLSFSRRNG